MLALSGVGCSKKIDKNTSKDQVKTQLMASIQEPFIILNAINETKEITLQFKNEGIDPLQVFSIDGGCSCRSVDQTNLPVSLKQHQMFSTKVSLKLKNQYDIQAYSFNFQTDKGLLSSLIKIRAIPRIFIEPDSVSNLDLDPESFWEFPLVLRVVKDDQMVIEPQLTFPGDFAVNPMPKRLASLDGVENVKFYEYPYKLKLTNHDVGLHRETVFLRGLKGSPAIESTILWRTRPYITFTPENIFITSNSVKIIFRCKNNEFAIKHISYLPKGINAIIRTPRELEVFVEKDAPKILDDRITVETNDSGNKFINLPIKRYSSD